MAHGTDEFYNPSKGRNETPTVIDWTKQSRTMHYAGKKDKDYFDNARKESIKEQRAIADWILSKDPKYAEAGGSGMFLSVTSDKYVWQEENIRAMAEIPWSWALTLYGNCMSKRFTDPYPNTELAEDGAHSWSEVPKYPPGT